MDWLWTNCPECKAQTIAVFEKGEPTKNYCGKCWQWYLTVKKPEDEK